MPTITALPAHWRNIADTIERETPDRTDAPQTFRRCADDLSEATARFLVDIATGRGDEDPDESDDVLGTALVAVSRALAGQQAPRYDAVRESAVEALASIYGVLVGLGVPLEEIARVDELPAAVLQVLLAVENREDRP